MSSPLSAPHVWNLVSSGYLEHNLEAFELFANEALRIACVKKGQKVVDIATGPGSLAVLAAKQGADVEALDFSAEMLELARKRCAEQQLDSVTLTQGDGQALPYADASFDAAFSMFGLMFFPNRARGFTEMHRVLRPGGKAVVSSWRPMNDIRILSLLFEGIFKAAPGLKPDGPSPPAPLSSPELMLSEMSAAGFSVEVEQIERLESSPSPAAFVKQSRTSFAPLCLMEEKLGAARFESVLEQTCTHIVQELGEGPIEFPMRALMGVGTAS